MGLQTAFYIVGIVFMSFMFLLVLGLFIAVMIIKSKINAIHRAIDDKVNKVKSFGSKINAVFSMARYIFNRK